MYQEVKREDGDLALIKRLSDEASIQLDPANTDFLEYQKWLALGNQPLPPDELTLPETV